MTEKKPYLSLYLSILLHVTFMIYVLFIRQLASLIGQDRTGQDRTGQDRTGQVTRLCVDVLILCRYLIVRGERT
jgi:hypothetical protein